MKTIKLTTLLVIISLATAQCTLFKKKDNETSDQKKEVKKVKRIEPNAEERAKQARDSGFTIFGKKMDNGGGVVSFATSNVMWRATLEVLDFMPLESIDYAGGLISSDWYKKNISDKEEIKIRVQFLSDELSPTSLKVISHKKICAEGSSCKIVKTSSNLTSQIKKKIIERAREIKIADENKNKK